MSRQTQQDDRWLTGYRRIAVIILLMVFVWRGLVIAHGVRESRVAAERRSHPVSPVVPFAAVLRAERIRKGLA